MRRALILHPASRCAAVERIEVEIERPGATQLLLRYTVTGRVGDLRLPPNAAPVRADGLWKHTCFEAFLRPIPGTAYSEFNFAPSTQWAAYRFSDTRADMRNADVAPPRITTQLEDGRYHLEAIFEIDAVASRLGISAVIEETGGQISYWALAHPASKPDFHHCGSFVADLPGV